MNATTVWSDVRGSEVRHTRLVTSHVTLCGLGTEHTRNFVRNSTFADVRCVPCQHELTKLNEQRFFDPAEGDS